MRTSALFAMPTRGKGPDILVDTSVAVALVVADHEHHLATMGAIGDRQLGLSGHAAFETFSVLTRLPPPAPRPPDVAVQLLAANSPQKRCRLAAVCTCQGAGVRAGRASRLPHRCHI